MFYFVEWKRLGKIIGHNIIWTNSNCKKILIIVITRGTRIRWVSINKYQEVLKKTLPLGNVTLYGNIFYLFHICLFKLRISAQRNTHYLVMRVIALLTSQRCKGTFPVITNLFGKLFLAAVLVWELCYHFSDSIISLLTQTNSGSDKLYGITFKVLRLPQRYVMLVKRIHASVVGGCMDKLRLLGMVTVFIFFQPIPSNKEET